ncbi:hypothetical protein OGAPHI_003050 [Ogataea philodendri]|uniref:Hcy-binding domain-containing protein n=1 Tax=Ogataea philodendri TaxID=1378263 RepID=A0A9P8T6Y2_9ASCO|nr:uncharacterized protein OGAPHI_003050 [Ogataea philodendri]KAH3667401.1 hypothetical protein OGAPHI_003050 [Ogataea philodendri]
MLLLDGALGTELEKRGVDVSGGLWSGRALVEVPDKVRQVHADYVASGVDILLTATYQLCDDNLRQQGLDPGTVYARAIELCRDAAKSGSRGSRVQIAGSIGPYGAFLANGEEYTGNYGTVTMGTLQKFHRGRLDALEKSPYVDLLAFETVPSFLEIKAIVGLLSHGTKQWYLSLSVTATSLADGTSFDDVVDWLDAHPDPKLVAIGANCCGAGVSVEVLKRLDSKLAKTANLQGVGLVIYPNSGEVYDGEKKVWTGKKSEFLVAAHEWLRIPRVKIVGGCCRTGPRDIGELRELIDSKSS